MLEIDFSEYTGQASRELGVILNARFGEIPKKQVRVISGRSTVTSPEKFELYLLPSDSAHIYHTGAPKSVCGIPQEHSGFFWTHPLRDALRIISDEGLAVAELTAQSLFLLTSVGETYRMSEFQAFEKTLQAAERLLRLPSEDWQKLLDEQRRQFLFNQDALFEKLAKGISYETPQSRLLSRIRSLEEYAQQTTSQMDQVARDTRLAEQNYLVIQASDLPQSFETFRSSFGELELLEHVRRARFENGTLLVDTDELSFIDLEGNERILGEFLISLNRLGQNAGVTWKNKTRAVNGFPAPNLDKTGHAAAGEVWTTFPTLLAEGEIIPLVSMAIQYVLEPNLIRGTYENWPLRETRQEDVLFADEASTRNSETATLLTAGRS